MTGRRRSKNKNRASSQVGPCSDVHRGTEATVGTTEPQQDTVRRKHRYDDFRRRLTPPPKGILEANTKPLKKTHTARKYKKLRVINQTYSFKFRVHLLGEMKTRKR